MEVLIIMLAVLVIMLAFILMLFVCDSSQASPPPVMATASFDKVLVLESEPPPGDAESCL